MAARPSRLDCGPVVASHPFKALSFALVERARNVRKRDGLTDASMSVSPRAAGRPS